jgi:hypothetical protein
MRVLTEEACHVKHSHHAHVCSHVGKNRFCVAVDHAVDFGIYPKDFSMDETFCI